MTRICIESATAGVGLKAIGSGANVTDTATTWFNSRTHFAPSTDKIPACARLHR